MSPWLQTVVVALAAFLATSGLAASFFTKGWRRPKLICPCGHVIGMHEGLGDCQAESRRDRYDSTGARGGFEWVACPCTQYYGPLPAETRRG